MKRIAKFFLLSMLAINFISCEESVQPVPFMGYEYFPDSVGQYVIYHVDSIWTDDAFNRKDTYEFGLKERVESMFIDNEGRPTQRIERFKDFINPDDSYVFSNISDVWYANLTQERAEKVEENVRYVKLIFPPANGLEWNGNAFNTEEDYGIDYRYTRVNEPFTDTLTGISFDSTMTVLQIDRHVAAGDEIHSLEVYAKNIGLVYKYYYFVNIQPDSLEPDLLREFGREYKYHYLEHGIE